MSAVDATITGQLALRGATLPNPDRIALGLDRATVGGGAFLDTWEGEDGQRRPFTATGEVRALGATITGQLNLRGGIRGLGGAR